MLPLGIVKANTLALSGPLDDIEALLPAEPVVTVGVPKPAAGPAGPVPPALPGGPVGPVGPAIPCGIVKAKTLAVSGPLDETAIGPVVAVGVPNPAAEPVGPVLPVGPGGPAPPEGPGGPVAP